MASERAASDGQALPPGKHLRTTAAALSNPEPPPSLPGYKPEPPPPSPGKNLEPPAPLTPEVPKPPCRKKGRRTKDSSQIGRVERELGGLRQTLGEVRDILNTFLGTFIREQESIKGLFRTLISKLDDVTRPSHNHCNHGLLNQETNQEGTGFVAEGLATTVNDGKYTSIRLRFLNEIKSLVYHEDDIKSIRIGIFDGDRLIKSGPLSKVKVEVLALEGSFPYDSEGSWTPIKEFQEHIAYGRDGKGNVLAGKGTNAQLMNGECHLGSIRFREGSCRARKGMFIIGARVCDGQGISRRVQEAVMNPVVVQDRRNRSNEKSHPPNLDDGVYRLEKIAINGKYRKRLEKEKIFTVEHFLKALYNDDDNLARILQIKKKCRDWDKMVKHAQECSLEGKPELKSYRCEERNVILFFNYVHRLVGAKFDGRYIASDMFEPTQQNLVDKLKKHAYDQLDDLIEDYVLKDNIPVPIHSDTDAVAGPSCMPSATQQENSGHQFAIHQVGSTPAIGASSHDAHTEPSCENANNAPGPNSSIPDPYRAYGYQAYNTQMLPNLLSATGIPVVQASSYGLDESQCAIANNNAGSIFSVTDHLRTQNYQGQGTRLDVQEQHFSACSGQDSFSVQAFSFGAVDGMGIGMYLLITHEDYESAFLQHQADINNYVEQEQTILIWPDNDTLEAATSAHTSMALARHQITNTGAPGSAGSVQGQTEAPLPNNGAAGSSESAQQAHPPQQ